MCGIAGILDLHGSEMVDEGLLRRMCATLVHRGPDDQGTYVSPGCGLGSCRLAILDLSAQGHMPMQDESGRYCIAYNGEVYNFNEIRADLEKDGETFRSHTDTEVVMKAIVRHGLEVMHRFNGMFAIALHDRQTRRTILARDRLGIKPLFYSVQSGKLVFGSEIKALWVAGVTKVLNEDRLGEQFALRYVTGPETIYKNVNRLLPGCCMIIENGRVNVRRWWEMRDYAHREPVARGSEIPEWYRSLFDSSIALRKISDVPVGVLLSGGLDSGSVGAAMARKSKQKISSFTVRFQENGFDEGELAKLIAEQCGLERNELQVSPNRLFELTRQMYRFHDEPMVHASDLHLMQIAKLAKSKVTVLLSGEGGDETLGGYTRYRPLGHQGLLTLGFSLRGLLGVWPLPLRKVRKLAHVLSLGSIERYIHFNSTEVFPTDAARLGLKVPLCYPYREQVAAEAKAVFPKEPLRQAMYYDMHTYLCSLLDRNDMMTMAASIECRVPFLDYRIVQGLLSLSTPDILRNGKPKGLLREALGSRLPQQALSARKLGFGVPWHQYYGNPEYRKQLQELPRHPIITQYFKSPRPIQAVTEAFLNGERSHFLEFRGGPGIIHQLMTLKIWFDCHFG